MDDLDRELDDVVLFELPTHEDVEAFRDRLRPRWDGWSDADEDVWLFTARFEQAGDLAVMLRLAEALVAELGLPAIYYCLDGRVYALEAAPASPSGDLAAQPK
jgi:hypothetical protein